jgi:sRNA-binding carbon storage regulator CsrA
VFGQSAVAVAGSDARAQLLVGSEAAPRGHVLSWSSSQHQLVEDAASSASLSGQLLSVPAPGQPIEAWFQVLSVAKELIRFGVDQTKVLRQEQSQRARSENAAKKAKAAAQAASSSSSSSSAGAAAADNEEDDDEDDEDGDGEEYGNEEDDE